MTRAKPALETAADLYPTRNVDRQEIMSRKDPVVYGKADDGPLDQDALDRYAETGFLFFPGFFKEDELEEHAEELKRLQRRDDVREWPGVITEARSNEIRSVFGVHDNNEILARLCRDERIVRIVRQLLGSEVYFHHSRINYKPGIHGREFYWHSDFETWHAEDGMPRMRAVSCTISLTPNDEFNGPLMVIPGSHRYFVSCLGDTPADHYKRSLKEQYIGVPEPETLTKLVEAGGLESLTGPTGSATFFECNVIHGSNSNITPFPRSNVFMVFNSVENTLAEPFSAAERRPEWISNRTNWAPVRPLA